MFSINDTVRVIASPDGELAQRPEDIGRVGFVLAIDHPSTGILPRLTVVLNPTYDGLGEKVHRALRFLTPEQIESC